MHEQPTLYKTTDFYLSAYLKAAGYPFHGCEFSSNGKATFVFADVNEADVLAYYNKEAKSKLAALDLVFAIRETRELLYNFPRQ